MNKNYNYCKDTKLSLLIQDISKKNPLKRRLSLFNLITFGMGAMIGGGIFVLPGIASYNIGPAVSISFLLAGLLSICVALLYSQLAIKIPSSGGCYVYAQICLGDMIGYITAITLIVVESLSMASVANGCSAYIKGLFLFLNKDFLLKIFIFKEFNFLAYYIIKNRTLLCEAYKR